MQRNTRSGTEVCQVLIHNQRPATQGGHSTLLAPAVPDPQGPETTRGPARPPARESCRGTA